MSLIPPYNSLATKIQQAVNQFAGQKITPQLHAQVKATVENVLHSENPLKNLEVDVVMGAHGQMQVNIKQKGPLFTTEPGQKMSNPFAKKELYKRTFCENVRLGDEYVTFFHDPMDVEPSDSYEFNQFFLY